MMKSTSLMSPVIASLCIAVLLCAAAPIFTVRAAEGQAVVNAQVAKQLTEAKKLAGSKQWDAALAALKKARAVPEKSLYADYKINEFTAYVLTQQKKYREAADVFEQIVDSRQAPAAAVAGHLKTAAQLYYQAEQYPRAVDAAGRALKEAPADPELLALLGQAQYLTKDFQRAAATFQRLVTATQQQGQRPRESWLQTLLNSYDQLGDRERRSATWDTLLRNYPKPDYWQAVLGIKVSRKQPEPIQHGYQWLMFDLGLLEHPADFEDLALSAIDGGLPGEAVRVLQSGLQRKILAGAEEARFRRMLAYAQRESTKSREALPPLVANAQRSGTGALSVALGRAYLSDAQYGPAVEALRRGLKQGGVLDADQSRIDLGVALLRNNQREQARTAFESVAASSPWHDLAGLWALRASAEVLARTAT
jgi:tetratricopeptide (TPR) repeat protein